MKFLIFLLFLIIFDSNCLINENQIKKEKLIEKYGRFQPTCLTCTALVSVFSPILKYDLSEPIILTFADLICKLFAKQPWAICAGITSQFKDEFFFVFRELARNNPSQICGIVLSDCADKSDPSQSGWVISLPEKIQKNKEKKQKKKIDEKQHLNVLQLTDLHIDFDYKYLSEAECEDPVCCRKLTVAPKKPAGYWGTVGKCDIPYKTVENMLANINSTQTIDYIIMTGDYINHIDWSYTIEEHLSVLRKMHQLIQDSFPATPIYWSLGNHEGVPVNSFAPHSVDRKFWPTWLYKQLKTMSSPWLNIGEYDDISKRGSYSTKLMNGLKLISLNTGFCEVTNFFLYLNQSDPDSTMSWLVQELYKSEKINENVHILAHIPPGNSECLEGWARNYYRVIQRFSSTISAQFFGHDHSDYFTIFYENMDDTTSKPINVGFAAPSVTTFEYLNPAYRIYQINPLDKFRVVDFTTYTTDLEKATEKQPPIWKKLYSTKADYKMEDLSPISWNKVAQQIFRSEKKRKQFFKYAHRTENPKCDEKCQFQLLCNLRMGHHNSSLYCPKVLL